MEKKKERYYVTVMVTNYVRKYLLNHFSVRDKSYPYLISVAKDPELSSFVKQSLKKPSYRNEKKIQKLIGAKRKYEVKIEITGDMFNRYGFEFSKTDEVRFSSIVEKRCKAQMLSFFSTQIMIHNSVEFAIQSFYKTFGYDEFSWPPHSLRKIWQRDRTIDKKEISCLISDKIKEIFMAQMSYN